MGTDQLSIDRSICPTVHSCCSVSADRRLWSVAMFPSFCDRQCQLQGHASPWAVRSPLGATTPRSRGRLACLHSEDERKLDPIVVLWGVRQHVRGRLPLHREVLACDWRPFEECAAVGSLAEIHAQCQNDRQLLGWHYAEDLLLDEADEYVQVDGCHVHCLVEQGSAPLHEPRARVGDVSRAVSVSREQAG